MNPAEGPRAPVEVAVEIEVRYAETDQMGIVHHAVYPVWFELARTRLCSETGYHYADIEKMGYLLTVTALECDFRQPARYGDHVSVACRIERLGSRGMRFAYAVRREDELLVRGTTRHVWLRRDSNEPCRAPEEIAARFARLAG